MTLAMGLAIVQLVALSVLQFGDIGFDKPGRYGLAFEHGLGLVVIYLVALAFGVYFAYSRRDLYAAIVQALLLVGCIPLAYYSSVKTSNGPAAEEHQDP